MENRPFGNRFWAEVIFAAFIVLGSAALLVKALDFPTVSAFLPIAMLVFLILFGSILAVTLVLQKEIPQTDADSAAPVGVLRVAAAFGSMVAYIVAVHFIGFYISTIMMVPVVAMAFGYRNLLGLTLATAIFAGGIYLIFSVMMGQQFPESFFLR